MLRNGVANAASSMAAPGPGALPPPPGGYLFGASGPDIVEPHPRWREATILWVLAHFLIGSTLFLGVMIGAFFAADIFGRDTTNPSPNAGALWMSYFVTLAAWLCFVFYRGTRRARLLFLAGLLAGAVAIASAAVIAGSPLIQH